MAHFHKKTFSRQHTVSITSAISRLAVLLFVFGFFAGFFVVQIFRDTLYAPSLALFQSTITRLPSLDIDCHDVFFYSLKENLKYFLLFVFFSLTNVWHVYLTGWILYTGFSHGVLGAFCVLIHGPLGIFSYLCFQLPQCLILVFLYLIALNHLEALHQSWFSKEYSDSTAAFLPNAQKRQLILAKLPFLLLCFLFLLLSSLAEGYANVFLLKAL